MSVCLEVSAIQATNLGSIDAKHPFFDNIRVLAPELLLASFVPPYYGDTVNLAFWRAVGINIGGVAPTVTSVLTLQPGWLYQLHYTRRTFRAYDETGKVQFAVDNVASIGDMCIDFTIYKSHQFEIIMDSALDELRFIIPTHLLHKTYPMIIQSVTDSGVDHIDSPFAEFTFGEKGFNGNIYGFDKRIFLNYYKYELRVLRDKLYDFGFLNYAEINFKKNVPNNGVYVDPFEIFQAERVLKTLGALAMEDFSWDLAKYAMSLYPDLMPVVRSGETQNNRPIYEPWIIWYLLFEWNKDFDWEVVDPEDVLAIFDLSPNWS